MPSISHRIGDLGAHRTLSYLERNSDGEWLATDLTDILHSAGAHDPPRILDEWLDCGLLTRDGATLSLTTSGSQTAILIDAINAGGDTQASAQELARLATTANLYSVVREGMTKRFLESLATRPIAGTVYVCSPWISLHKYDIDNLTKAVLNAKSSFGSTPEILVRTRPVRGTDSPPKGMRPFFDIGAKVFLNKKLHAKLYVREPGLFGGYQMGILGSQNLTKSRYQELGVMIESDSRLIRAMIQRFLELTHMSTELL